MDIILLAAGITFIIFLFHMTFRISIGMYWYEKIKKIILFTVYSYFKDIDVEYINLDILKKIIEKRFKYLGVLKKIEFIKLKWITKEKFKLDFKLNFRKSLPVYSYLFNIKKIKKTFSMDKRKGVDFEEKTY